MMKRVCFVVSALWLGGCDCGAEGNINGGACDDLSCPAGQHCEDGTCVDDEVDPCADVECEGDQFCRDGECVDPLQDEDGDGFLASEDCDDQDPAVIPGSTRDCGTECGDGTQICRDGEWSECSAPVPPCDCDDGDVREEPCARCGTAERACVDGSWAADPGPCTGQGDCEAGTWEERACEGFECGMEERSCGEDCSWDDWSDCSGDDELCLDVVEACCSTNFVCVPC